MEEKTYKIMSGSGATSIAVGVVTLVTGLGLRHPDDREAEQSSFLENPKYYFNKRGHS